MHHTRWTQCAATAALVSLCFLGSLSIPSSGRGADVQDAFVKAIEANDLDAARSAVAQGADVNRPGPFHRTALHRAASHAPEAIVAWLLEQGADPNARDDDGRTPLHLALDGAWATRLLQAKADPHLVDHKGNSPLHTAAELDEPSMAQVLVEAGVPVDVRNQAGLTPLHFAACQGQRRVAEFLLDRGADINAATTADYQYKWTYVGWDAKGMETLVPQGSTPTALARGKHRSNKWVTGSYRAFAEFLVSRGASEPKWWQFWR